MRFPTNQYNYQLYPSPSSPYYLFGYQQRWPFAWSGGQGGILPSAQANTHAPPSSLGMADMLESGYGDPNWIPYPAFRRTILHRPAFAQALGLEAVEFPAALRARGAAQLRQLGDWPLMRPTGPEPLHPGQGVPSLGALSDNEKTFAIGAAALAAAWFLFLRKHRRRNPRNPRRRGYYVMSKVRGVSGAIVLPNKQEAMAYANYLRRSGRPARIKKR